MKFLHTARLLFCITSIMYSYVYPSMSSDQQEEYHEQELLHNNLNAQVESLIKMCYFSPELQYHAIKAIGQQVIINRTTGIPTNIPSVQEIIDYQAHTQNALEKKLQGLQAALEATYIAYVLAEIQLAYTHSHFLLWGPSVEPAIANIFKEKITAIHTAINQTQPDIFTQVGRQIYNFFFTSAKLPHYRSYQPTINGQNLTFPDEFMEQVIQYTSYVKQYSTKQAAQILFQQFFLLLQAQVPRNYLVLDINNQHTDQTGITPYTYLYTESRKPNNIITHVTHIIQNLSASTPKSEIHETLQFIEICRQAVQLSLYIANKNSSFNGLLHYFTFSAAKNINYMNSRFNLLDGIVQELLSLDRQFAKLSTTLQAKAFMPDGNNSIINDITKTVAGIALVAGTAYVAYQYGSHVNLDALSKVINNPLELFYTPTPPAEKKPLATKPAEKSTFTENVMPKEKNTNPEQLSHENKNIDHAENNTSKLSEQLEKASLEKTTALEVRSAASNHPNTDATKPIDIDNEQPDTNETKAKDATDSSTIRQTDFPEILQNFALPKQSLENTDTYSSSLLTPMIDTIKEILNTKQTDTNTLASNNYTEKITSTQHDNQTQKQTSTFQNTTSSTFESNQSTKISQNPHSSKTNNNYVSHVSSSKGGNSKLKKTANKSNMYVNTTPSTNPQSKRKKNVDNNNSVVTDPVKTFTDSITTAVSTNISDVNDWVQKNFNTKKLQKNQNPSKKY